jgi:type VI secretion system protein ImpA
MASPAVLDFAKLLAPISPEKPTGVDPRSDISPTSMYYQIKGARSDARAAERQVAGGDNANPPDWTPVRDKGMKALAEQAKDLEITAYLIEALLRLKGFAGLRDGFRLARELVEKFWDGLYPLPDEEGVSTRIAPLIGLNGQDSEGTLIAPIARVPITDSTSVGRFTLAHYNEGNSLKKITDPKAMAKRLEAGAVSLEMFDKAVAETEAAFYRNLVDDLTACMAEFAKLGETLDKRCDGRGPPTSNVREALTVCLDTVKRVSGDKWKPAPEAPKEAGKEAGAPTATAPAAKPAPAPAGVIQNRAQALDNLRKVAEFFRRTEPHSPVSYALEQVVRWGNMSLPELWTELIADEAPRKNVFKQVGIRPAEDAKVPPKK